MISKTELDVLALRYKEVSEKVLAHLANLETSSRYRDHVYRIYTRADKQQGRFLKEVWKIAATMAKHGYENLWDVHDVIGMTVVVPYPSDIDVVREFITAHSTAGTWQIYKEKRKDMHGYYAYHFVVTLRETVLSSIKCEIQIKTVLQDAWVLRPTI